MTQVTLHIDSKKKWTAIKAVLEAMDIAYDTQQDDVTTIISEKEEVLLLRAKSDVSEGRVFPYSNHREILGR